MSVQELISKLPMKFDDVPSITNKGGDIRVLISPKTVNSTKLIMGIARLEVNECLIEHVHDYGEETFFVKSGKGVVVIDDNEIQLSSNSVIMVPQGSRHKVINTGTECLELIFATAPLAPTAEKGDRITN